MGRTAIVLAGGTSRRMGTDKAWLDRAGEPAVVYVCRQALRACERVVLSAAAGQRLPALPAGVEVDRDRERQGPLRGLLGAIERVEAGVVWLGAVDLPVVDPANLTFLFAHLGRADALVPCDRGGPAMLCSVARVSAIRAARDALASERRLGALFEAIRTEEIDARRLPHPEALRSCNTPEEWQAAMAEL